MADVNLKFIWDVVSRIKIGDKGKAYVIDGNGFLIADPDIGLVLMSIFGVAGFWSLASAAALFLRVCYLDGSLVRWWRRDRRRPSS